MRRVPGSSPVRAIETIVSRVRRSASAGIVTRSTTTTRLSGGRGSSRPAGGAAAASGEAASGTAEPFGAWSPAVTNRARSTRCLLPPSRTSISSARRSVTTRPSPSVAMRSMTTRSALAPKTGGSWGVAEDCGAAEEPRRASATASGKQPGGSHGGLGASGGRGPRVAPNEARAAPLRGGSPAGLDSGDSRTMRCAPMKARFAVMVVLAAALTEGCRRAETPAPSPSPTVAVATPTRPRPPLHPDSLARRPFGRRRPPRPLARHRAGARPLPGPLRDDEGSVRHRGDARVGAPRGRPLLQPRAGRLLRRRRLLPCDRRLHGPVRDQRRTPGQCRVAGGPASPTTRSPSRTGAGW